MGTSISQPSPRNTNWKPVLSGYASDKVSEARIVNEIWRASDKEALSLAIKSETVYSCYEAVKSSSNFQEALAKANQSIRELKGNSMMAEFAKRTIPLAFQSTEPTAAWSGKFFSEVTKYILSRDTSGFVGEKYRNKTVKELIAFKTKLAGQVDQIVGLTSKEFRSHKEWIKHVDTVISKLKSNE